MPLPDLKYLAKLAETCRKAGIKSFKGEGIEFTLDDSAPTPRTRRKKGEPLAAKPSESVQGPIESDAPTADELQFWSAAAGGIPFENDDTGSAQ